MSDFRPNLGARFNMNWVITNDVESLEQYAEIFTFGKLVPLESVLTPFTDLDAAKHGMMQLMKQRQAEVMQMPHKVTEHITYYSVLTDKEWAEMKVELTKPKPSGVRNIMKLRSEPNWLEMWKRNNYLPSALTFLSTNSAFVNSDTFWEIRFSNDDGWRRLVAEHIPPQNQFVRRTQ